MIERIIRSMRGYVKIRVQGYSAERFLNLCSHHQIYIWGLEPKENHYELYMSLQGFRKIRPLAKKTHTKIALIKRCGFPFFLYKNRNRHAYTAGIILCIGLLFFYSSYIWDIHFEGNEKWTDQVLLEFLETKNVTPAMPKGKIDCSRIVKDIRTQYNDIVWVSASIDGSRLRIQIKENEDTFRMSDGTLQENGASDKEQKAAFSESEEVFGENTDDETTDTMPEIHPTDLIAAEDGVITSIITRSGVPQVHVGDTVKKGDVLVSGRVEVLNDAKEVIDYQYRESDADIYADTQMNYRDSMSMTYQQKNYISQKQRKAWYVRLGSRKISIGFTKTKEKFYERSTSEHQLKLGESFYLPVSYGEVGIKPYTTKQKKHTREQAQVRLTEKFNSFLEELEEKGIQICEKNVKIHMYENSAAAEGTLYLNKPITEVAETEILKIERNEPNESFGTDD